MSFQVFISYRHQGGEAMAYLLKEKLQQQGYTVFFDTESLSNGRFDEKLLDVIASCGTVIVVLNPGALDRCRLKDDWLKREIAQAIKTNRTIIPVMLGDFQFPDRMPNAIVELSRWQGVEFSFSAFESCLNKLCSMIELPSVLPPETMQQVLFWGDFDLSSRKKIERKLDLPDKSFMLRHLEDAVDLLSYDLHGISTIVLLDTDVTKLAGNDKAIQRVNDALFLFTQKGGRLVLSHDAIYRRTRNVKLQEMLGCVLDRYQPTERVHYVKTEDCRAQDVFNTLPDEFDLTDCEICWCDREKLPLDAVVFFETPDGIPLVFGRASDEGYVIWMNSGEFTQGRPPPSLLKPEPCFVQLLRHAILDDFSEC